MYSTVQSMYALSQYCFSCSFPDCTYYGIPIRSILPRLLSTIRHTDQIQKVLSFEELEKLNPEVFGWLNIYGTQIDYPIVQGEDNEKYLNTNAEGNYSLSGALFLDYENSPDFSDYNSIIFGHHMDQGAMFGEIDLFKDQDFLDTHRYGSLYYNHSQYGLELVCYLDADAYDTSVYGILHSENGREEYLNNIIGKSLAKSDVSVFASDQLVLLSTCSTTSTNGRHILVGRITEEVQPDTFIKEETINKGTGIDSGNSWIQYLRNLGGWIWIIPLFILVLIILLLLYRKKRRKDR